MSFKEKVYSRQRDAQQTIFHNSSPQVFGSGELKTVKNIPQNERVPFFFFFGGGGGDLGICVAFILPIFILVQKISSAYYIYCIY